MSILMRRLCPFIPSGPTTTPRSSDYREGDFIAYKLFTVMPPSTFPYGEGPGVRRINTSVRKTMFVISADGTGDYLKINDALDCIPTPNLENVTLYLKNGVYKEKVRLMGPNIRLVGEDVNKTVITFDDCAKKIMSDGKKMGTFNSYTLYIGGCDFFAENITFENSAGDGDTAGQAIAVSVDADRAVFKKCRFLGCQDTLYTGPMPGNPVPVGVNPMHPFAGYSDFNILRTFRQYYENCFIRGDIDFIFGSARAVFNRCTIFSNDRKLPVNGYVSAASTYSNEKYGYLFLNCDLISDAPPGTVYLGRPWKKTAKTVFINCSMENHIIREGWHDWDNAEARTTAFFAEGNSHGPGASDRERPDWIHILSEREITGYTIQKVLSGEDGWNPEQNRE
jgi:pectinesterase